MLFVTAQKCNFKSESPAGESRLHALRSERNLAYSGTRFCLGQGVARRVVGFGVVLEVENIVHHRDLVSA